MMSCWAMVPANSSSLLLITPVGLSKETREETTTGSKGERQRIGWVDPSEASGMKATPPMPGPAASQAPDMEGLPGSSSAIRVGRVSKETASHRKSSRKSWILSVRRSRRPWSNGDRKAVCKVLNNPRAPGMPRAMERSSPRSWCQVLVETRRRDKGILAKSS
jgi:hypothetical protein